MKIYTKESLIQALKEIGSKGWIKNARQGNAGGIGNTLEDLLGIEENNLPIPNASEWELKCQRIGTSSLTTLFHMEPSPRILKIVPQILLKKYGWEHQTIDNAKSFRQTIHTLSRSDRGFKVVIDHIQRKVLISFDAKAVSEKHSAWLKSVEDRAGLDELDPQPYWGFDDLFHKAGTKLLNCFYVQADVKHENKEELFHYKKILMLQKFSLEKFIDAIECGVIRVDIDARTGKNHGPKFRIKPDRLPDLYAESTTIV